MEKEISIKKCNLTVSQMHKREIKLNLERDQIKTVINQLKYMDDTALTKVAHKLNRQLDSYDQAIYKLQVLRKTLDRIIELNVSTEDQITAYDGGLKNIGKWISIKKVDLSNLHIMLKGYF